MISIKPIYSAPITNNNRLSRAYFFVPTSVIINNLGNAQFAVFSMGGGQIVKYNNGTSIPSKNKSIIACGNTTLYLDSFSLNIGTNSGDYERGIEEPSKFKIYQNSLVVFEENLDTDTPKGAYKQTFACDLFFAQEDSICFTFDCNSAPPTIPPSIYLNLVLAFTYEI